MKQKAHVKSASFLARIWRVILVLVFIGVMLTVSRGVVRLISSGNRVNVARENLEEVKYEQDELKAQLEEVNSDFYREKAARDQLGLAHPGETVIVLPEESLLRRLSPRLIEQENLEPPEPNWRKWAKLFF
ncbi:hypothetical protein A2803_03195 [Candidatus Woesebacteria bacterium RIFCSPHIGHO2_01_FULL_44_21]|uniref:Septum formation initiator n=1 Tax=Candidatus Woesebacteria bacterium RIFCSPHIGHO2_01_FULL_44_21 TaxID=1802503 RepID=A0A1F7YYU5_9BACT|nr:MAG: hypothetical protein A2803_03195 [Candidatus Woesebacteria bacterium RIFCSPHIGHO2_01_FULL_44_21]OGM69160.1 MAG: hypothetical protein A2897_05050 [Candidatus Woesebacteria bacterium RIFCSPLOWO2_01_FULL_44_24b]